MVLLLDHDQPPGSRQAGFDRAYAVEGRPGKVLVAPWSADSDDRETAASETSTDA